MIETYVSSGQTFVTVDIEYIQAGSSAVGATVGSGDRQIVLGGGTTSDTIVERFGEQVIEGGSSFGTILDGGSQTILFGAAYETVINSGGEQINGGAGSGTLINAGGLQIVSSGTPSATQVNSGGEQLVEAGSALGTIVNSGGLLWVVGGGTVGATISAGGEQLLAYNPMYPINVEPDANLTEVDVGARQIVSSGGTTESALINGGEQIVDGAARITNTIVKNGGTQTIEYATASQYQGAVPATRIFETYLSNGGTQIVNSASVSSTTSISGGAVYVSAGGIATSTYIGTLGAQFVRFGGIAVGGIVDVLGVEVVESGGSASFTYVKNGGLLVVLPGGSATATVADPNGNVVSGNALVLEKAVGTVGQGNQQSHPIVQADTLLYAFAGGQTTDALVNASGTEMVDGGTAINTRIANSGLQFVYAGSAAGTEVSGYQAVFGGDASGTLVRASGQQDVFGGTAAATIVSSGGDQFVGGGVATGTTIGAHAYQTMSGGESFGTFVESGGEQYVSGGIASGTVVGSGGLAYAVAGDLQGSIVQSGGEVAVASAGSAVGTQVLSGGRLYVGSGGTVSGLVLFAPDTSGGSIAIASGANFAATISGFVAGDTIDLRGLAYSGNAGGALANNQLLVSQGAASQTLAVDPIDAGNLAFSFADDGHGGTAVFAGADAALACFAEGTRIATAQGDVRVEELRPGVLVALATGGTAPVVWLGHRAVDCSRHPRPTDVWPVRITAHAFGLGRPARDVLLSPDHAVWMEGVLIPVRYLLNDATVRQVAAARVTYWHVELPFHAVLLAEGLPAESYLDTGNRGAFANGGRVVAAQPDFSRGVWQRASCATLVTEGPVRDLVYRRLLAQAHSLGWSAADAGLGAMSWTAPRAA